MEIKSVLTVVLLKPDGGSGTVHLKENSGGVQNK